MYRHWRMPLITIHTYDFGLNTLPNIVKYCVMYVCTFTAGNSTAAKVADICTNRNSWLIPRKCNRVSFLNINLHMRACANEVNLGACTYVHTYIHTYIHMRPRSLILECNALYFRECMNISIYVDILFHLHSFRFVWVKQDCTFSNSKKKSTGFNKHWLAHSY
jgi:hypothetical protein